MITWALQATVVIGVPASSCATVSGVKNTTYTHTCVYACTYMPELTHPNTHRVHRAKAPDLQASGKFLRHAVGSCEVEDTMALLACRLFPAWHRAQLNDVNTHTHLYTYGAAAGTELCSAYTTISYPLTVTLRLTIKETPAHMFHLFFCADIDAQRL